MNQSPIPGKALGLLLLLSALSGCAELAQPPATPAPPPEEPAALEVAPRSPESEAMAVYYRRVQTNLLAQGLLRTDGGGTDTPFSTRQLVENFVRIALYDEYVTAGGGLIARQTPSRLRRWEEPIRMSVEFGPSVPLAQREKDKADIAGYVARLARSARHPVRMSDRNPNYIVLMLNEDERRAIGPRLMELVPGIDRSSVRSIADMPPSTFCLVFAFSNGSGSTYSKAVAVIRAEHPDALRLSCIHEELAQGMGLANDSPAARPSIFNDDEEFGLLTRHDELLLRILYDRRLKPGMIEDEARPIVEVIASELLGGES
ncbi:DUF2927 domain-containing protein [Ostreiculturibacter nitratireducens]|uniref:DUF2927 domain-containing protein n=1 Tax=Ostreiculturibacter nitratireducens TaxID=3075226 RepID=UPI0031B5CF58